jgi:C4-dicarboxylate transporter, DctQ subunit
MILLAFMQVVLREVFGTGVVWADTIVRHLILWLGFVGAALASKEGRHIGIVAITRFLSERVRRVVFIFTSTFAAIVCFCLALAALIFIREEWTYGGELVLGIQTWVALLVIPAGYSVTAFHFLITALQSGINVFSKRKEGHACQ